MKKAIVFVLLMAGVGAVAFANLSNRKKADVKKEHCKESKKECSHHCPYSL